MDRTINVTSFFVGGNDCVDGIVVQEVTIELKASSLDLQSSPSVVFCYGDEVSRSKYCRCAGGILTVTTAVKCL